MQHEITSRAPLLDAAGNLREAGYAKRLLPVYDRAAIRAGAARIKEWDYYLVANDHYAVALTIDDNGYMGLDSISFLHFDERWEKTKSPMRAFPTGAQAARLVCRGRHGHQPEALRPLLPPRGGRACADVPHGGLSGRAPRLRAHPPDGRAGGVDGHLHAV